MKKISYQKMADLIIAKRKEQKAHTGSAGRNDRYP